MVQMATLIYNDRIATWKQMKKLDEQLDNKPTAKAVAAIAELRIRNNQCFSELQAYNDTGKFRYVHPLIVHQSESNLLKKLLEENPAEFLRQHKNVLDNIRRYQSYLKRADRADRRDSDRAHLKEYRDKASLFQSILQSKES